VVRDRRLTPLASFSAICNLSPMAKAPVTKHFTHHHQEHPDGSLSFDCSTDQADWPWLALPPFDPIPMQTINYWAPVEIGATRQTFDRNKWTALTQTTWQCGAPDAGPPVRGVAEPLGAPGSMDYVMHFYDADDALVYTMSGKGVVFQNRDFEGWRAQAKAKMAKLPKPDRFTYALAALTGAARQYESFISPLLKTDPPTLRAMVTKENGFIPNHSAITGSGDHVNATHLAVIGLQAAHLLEAGRAIRCTSGSMTFERFVELGYPIDIALVEDRRAEGIIGLEMRQAGKLCTVMRLEYEAV